VLSVDDAKQLAATWRARFKDEADFEASWARYMDSATVPDVARLEAWLAKDLDKSEVKHIGVPQEPLVPTLSRYDLNGCYHCYGRGFVRLDVDAHHPDFGKARPCRACRGRDGDQSAHCTNCAQFSSNLPTSERNLCYQCGGYQDERGRDKCRNPKWHDPNWTTGDYPHERPVPGWKTAGSALP
jgi:hypothetical protein